MDIRVPADRRRRSADAELRGDGSRSEARRQDRPSRRRLYVKVVVMHV